MDKGKYNNNTIMLWFFCTYTISNIFIIIYTILHSGKRLYKRFKNIYCSDECKNVIKELKNLTYKKDKKGNIIEDEFNIDPHTFSAIWYALDGYEVSDLKQFDRNKYYI